MIDPSQTTQLAIAHPLSSHKVREEGGPAGESYRNGEGGTELELDAVQLCRIPSGRGEADPGLTAMRSTRRAL